MTSNTQCDKLRGEGNLLYKMGRLDEAIKKYQEAAKHGDPQESAPLRNLSAAYYEIGNYRKCITAAEQALKLIEKVAEEDIPLQKEKLQKRIKKAKDHFQRPSIEEKTHRRIKIMKMVERYKPSLFPCLEYYTVGHDSVFTMFDAAMESVNPSDDQISFLFGGVGDARHLYRTLLDIDHHEQTGKTQPKRYHCTLVDVNKFALVRDLIIMMLLQDLSVLASMYTDEAINILNTLYFIYFSPMMPRCAFEMLQKTISKAIAILQDEKQPVEWVYLQKKDVGCFIDALCIWRDKVLGAMSNAKVVQQVKEEMSTSAFVDSSFISATPQECQKEKVLYVDSAVLFPPQRILQLYDTEMLDLVTKYAARPRKNADKFKQHLLENWRINVTLIDPEWLKQSGKPDFSHDPFILTNSLFANCEHLRPSHPSRLYDYFAAFFIPVTQVIRNLRGRFQAEVIPSDYIDTAERLQFNLYHEPEQVGGGFTKWPRPGSFPTLYDRIHLSNVPDYLGGHLTTFLFAMPLLKRQPSSILVSNCLRNTPVWDDIEDYLAEYQLISDENMLRQLTQVKIIMRGTRPLPLADPMAYQLCNTTLKHQFSELLPRTAFNKWFYGLFFKLALPYKCNIRDVSNIIYSPLNLTIIFHLISHLRILGYPSHWLSEALTNILSNSVMTTARPPRKLPLNPADVKRKYQEKRLSVAPFIYEMATLAQLFQPLLPFSLRSELLIPLEDISQYIFNFSHSSVEPASKQPSCLTLLFWDEQLLKDIKAVDGIDLKWDLDLALRSVLDPSWGDEVDNRVKGSLYVKFREEGVAMWTTLEFNVKEQYAKAWLPDQFIQIAKKKGWHCGIYRTDIWRMVFEMEGEIGEKASQGVKWVWLSDDERLET